MNSIFDKASNELMQARISKITENTKPLWGSMTADQMCVHCDNAIRVAFGEMDLKINFAMRILGKLLKNKVFYGKEMRKNSPTAKEFIVTKHFEFDSVKTTLLQNFSRFATEGKKTIKVLKHPFWGELTYEEWDILMWKHLDHHLNQFGV